VTGDFRSVALPDIGDVSQLAVAKDGSIAAGMINYVSHTPDTVEILRPGALSPIAVHVESWALAPTATGFVTGLDFVHSVRFDGSISDISLVDGQRFNPRIKPQMLPDGRVAVATTSGIDVLDVLTGKQTSLPLGAVPCGRGADKIAGVTTSTVRNQTCVLPANSISVTVTGDLIEFDQARGVQRVVAGTF
jgi:hypothetical protein